MEGSFLFITPEIEFMESTPKGARVLATLMELDKPSQNGRIYRFIEGAKIATSLVGRTIKFGANWLGKHVMNTDVIGKVEKTWQEGNKIKGIVLIWAKNFVDRIKAGEKFLFSVGGVAKFAEVIQIGKKLFTKLHDAVCTHLQMLPNNPSGAGFPSAKMEKVIEINESVLFTNDIQVCHAGICKVLKGINDEFEEAKALEKEIDDQIIMEIVAEDIKLIAKYFVMGLVLEK